MSTWRHGLLGFLTTFMAALIGVLVAEYLIARFDMLAPFSALSGEDYKDVALLASEVLPTGVYVRYRNTGTKTIDGAEFKFKYYEKGRLVEESDEFCWETVPPGQVAEGVVTPERLLVIPLKGRTVKVICNGGFTKDD